MFALLNNGNERILVDTGMDVKINSVLDIYNKVPVPARAAGGTCNCAPGYEGIACGICFYGYRTDAANRVCNKIPGHVASTAFMDDAYGENWVSGDWVGGNGFCEAELGEIPLLSGGDCPIVPCAPTLLALFRSTTAWLSCTAHHCAWSCMASACRKP